jgi:hypothetical protein
MRVSMHAGHHRSGRPKVNGDEADGVNRRHTRPRLVAPARVTASPRESGGATGVEVAPLKTKPTRFPASWSRSRRHPGSVAVPAPSEWAPRGLAPSLARRRSARRGAGPRPQDAVRRWRVRRPASALRPERWLLSAKTPPAPGTLPTALRRSGRRATCPSRQPRSHRPGPRRRADQQHVEIRNLIEHLEAHGARTRRDPRITPIVGK